MTAGTVVGAFCFMSLLCVPPSRMSRTICLQMRTPLSHNDVMSKKKLPPEVRAYFVKMGKKGGALGGHARAARMTDEERTESSRKAALARWKKARDEPQSDSR